MNQSSKSGFSLIELMIAVAVLAILAAAAIPQYQLLVERAYQADSAHIVATLSSQNLACHVEKDRYCSLKELQFPNPMVSGGGGYDLSGIPYGTSGVVVESVILGNSQVFQADWSKPGGVYEEVVIVAFRKNEAITIETLVNVSYLQLTGEILKLKIPLGMPLGLI